MFGDCGAVGGQRGGSAELSQDRKRVHLRRADTCMPASHARAQTRTPPCAWTRTSCNKRSASNPVQPPFPLERFEGLRWILPPCRWILPPFLARLEPCLDSSPPLDALLSLPPARPAPPAAPSLPSRAPTSSCPWTRVSSCACCFFSCFCSCAFSCRFSSPFYGLSFCPCVATHLRRRSYEKNREKKNS